jgi:hypothetical protein
MAILNGLPRHSRHPEGSVESAGGQLGLELPIKQLMPMLA